MGKQLKWTKFGKGFFDSTAAVVANLGGYPLLFRKSLTIVDLETRDGRLSLNN